MNNKHGMSKKDALGLFAKVLRGEPIDWDRFRIADGAIISAIRLSPGMAFDVLIQGRACPDELLGDAVMHATPDEKTAVAELLSGNQIPSALNFARKLYAKYVEEIWPLEESAPSAAPTDDYTDLIKTREFARI